MASKKGYLIFLVIFFFIAVHLLFIFFSPDTLHAEEGKEGSLGIDIINGRLQIPFWCYLDSPHAGGSILAGLLITPFYLIFGDRYLAIKICSLFFSVLTLILISKLLLKEYPPKILVPLGILFCISTPHYLQKSLIFIGNTNLFLFFLFLNIFIAYKILVEKKRYFLLLGFTSGLGLWVQYGQVSFILLFFFLWFLKDKFFWVKKEFFLFLSGFFLGFSPWIIYNLLYDFASIHCETILSPNYPANIVEFFKRIFILLFVDIPRSYHFTDVFSINHKILAYFPHSLFILSFGMLIYRNSKIIKHLNLEKIFILFILFSLFIFSFKGQPIGGNGEWNSMNVQNESYILFLQPFIFLVIAISMSKLRYNFYSLLNGLLFIGLLIPNVNLYEKNLNKFILRPARNIKMNVLESGFNYINCPKTFIKVLDEIPPKFREKYFCGAGKQINSMLNGKGIKPVKNIFNNLSGYLKEKDWEILLLHSLVGKLPARKNILTPEEVLFLQKCEFTYKLLNEILSDDRKILLKKGYNNFLEEVAKVRAERRNFKK